VQNSTKIPSAIGSGTHSVNKNANGMLLLSPESVIIAEETKGPMKAEVLPTTEKRAKKRNLQEMIRVKR
jgi:hypothetical protein